ncbi:tetratricopeptide repeat protein 16 [Arvicola amphibius]|uniref:tetratricopeptide repeat protein 16 n=1 Tax=Arvicola amphibius TaxID=1047088 RepID=UPI001C0A3DA9|nr:tetratricopeptide repeat protein 16 [Arvicola amphibius]
MTDDSQVPDNAHSKKVPKLRVHVPEDREETLQRVFGTSQVFYSFDRKPRTGSTVPVKVKEYYHQGHQCLEHEDWENAVLFFSRALHLNPNLANFYVFRAEAFIQLCDFSSALQNLRRAYSYQPENSKYLERLAFVLYLQGQCLYELCDFQEALYVFLQASDLQPQNPSFCYRCIACLLALNRHQDCLSLITREVKQGRASADVYILRARIYNFFQKPKLCYQDLRSALLFDPKHPQAKGLLQMMVNQAKQSFQDASILAVQGKLHRALKRICCAIENNPLDPNLFLFRGTMYRRLKQFDPAVEDFLKALDMVTDSQGSLVQKTQRQLLLTYNDFAVHCYTQGSYQEGVLLLNKAIRDEQKEKSLYINRGDCFFQLGNLAFAEADYKQALALSPQDEGANLRMGVLQEKMGFCEQTRRQFHTAEDHFSTAIKHNPEKPQYYMHRAKSRQLMQNVLGAREDVATVLLLNPNYPKIAPLMTNLFPGMTVEDVLKSQVAQLAKLQLSRMLESGPKAIHPQSIVGLDRQRLMERQKARALMESWNREYRFTGNLEEELATQTLQGKTELKRGGAQDKKNFIYGAEDVALARGPPLPYRWWMQQEPGGEGSGARFTVEILGYSLKKAGLACKSLSPWVLPSIPESVRNSKLGRQSAGVEKKSWRYGSVVKSRSCFVEDASVGSSTQWVAHSCLDRQLQVKPRKVTSLSDSYVDQTSSGSVFSILSLSTLGMEITDSQEYRSTSNTAVMSPGHSRPQSSGPRKNRENLGLSRAPKVTQASENLDQNLLETTPAYGQRRHSSKAEATQSPKPGKTEPPQSPGRQGPSQKSRMTEATEGPKPRKNRPALTPKQRLRRAKAVRAQSWKPRSQVHSQKPTKTSSETISHGRSESSSSETQDQSPGPSSSEDTSSYSENTASSSSKTNPIPEPSLQLGKAQDPQDGDLSSNKTDLLPEPSLQLGKAQDPQDPQDGDLSSNKTEPLPEPSLQLSKAQDPQDGDLSSNKTEPLPEPSLQLSKAQDPQDGDLSSNKTEPPLELSLQLGKAQDQNLSSSKAEFSPTPSQSAAP